MSRITLLSTGALSAAIGCATRSPQDVRTPAPEPAASAPAPATPSWPPRAELLLTQAGDRLVLRAFGAAGLAPFEHVIASQVLEHTHDPELELLWFSDEGGRLWVTDLRALTEAPAHAPNVLIASDVPEHEKLSVWVGERYVEGPGQLGEGAVELGFRWETEPHFETDESDSLGRIEGSAWLERERHRPSRAVPPWQQPDEPGPHVPLPPALAQCDNPELCGAARPFGPSGWQLVITKTDETHGDFFHYGCLLHDPARAAFARPPDTRTWLPAPDPDLDTCGPYRFNQAGDTFLAADKACRIGQECTPLAGIAIGWLEPGVVVGRE